MLDKMLKEQKINLHRTIAETMESEQVQNKENNDIGRLLTLFDHWKSCGNFGKAAPLALAVGLRLEDWDLSPQSLDLYRDALEMCYESADNSDGREPVRDGEMSCRLLVFSAWSCLTFCFDHRKGALAARVCSASDC